MNAHQTINSWLSKMNPYDTGLVLDRYGQCQLISYDSTWCTVLVPTDSSAAFTLYADLWPLPNGAHAATYENLLALNLLGIKTLGCILGFDKQLRSLVLSYRRDIGSTDFHQFCAVVENFLAAAADMKKQVIAIFKAGAHKPGPASIRHSIFRNISSS
jgi:hypothetical protein